MKIWHVEKICETDFELLSVFGSFVPCEEKNLHSRYDIISDDICPTGQYLQWKAPKINTIAATHFIYKICLWDNITFSSSGTNKGKEKMPLVCITDSGFNF